MIKRVAITGAAGHLGGAVVRALLEAGADVRVLVHSDRRALEGLAVEVHDGDIQDTGAVARLVADRDLVIHLAAVISLEARDEPLMRAINVDAVQVVADACLAAGVRLVHASSIHAFSSRPIDQAVDESRGPAEANAPAYDRSKAAGEAIVRDAVARGLDAVIVNPTAVIGPYDFRPSRMGEVMLDLYHRRLAGLVAGGFDWVDVRDIATSVIAAGERGQRGQSYLLPGHWASVVDLASRIEALTGKRRPRFVSPMWLARGAAPFAVGWARLRHTRPLFTPTSLVALRNHQIVSGARARRELGHDPRPLDDTLRDTFAWFAEHGRLAENG
ncbi:MAG TPA: NAD-dependent epimerase/dehydratase family protein [Kofleriaceae bacterium]|nr:NAD-dependent epimerase/dehydratase family protein [Kofleriaceae bacterium]